MPDKFKVKDDPLVALRKEESKIEAKRKEELLTRGRELAERDVSVSPDELTGVGASSRFLRSKSGGLGKDRAPDQPIQKRGTGTKKFNSQTGDPEDNEKKLQEILGSRGDDPTSGVSSGEVDAAFGIQRDRSEAARAADRGKDAEVTEDLAQWRNNPESFDFPGVDTEGTPTVDVDDLEAAQRKHGNRPRKSRKIDEQQLGVVTTDFGVWEDAPGEYDFPGVDTPDGFEFDITE